MQGTVIYGRIGLAAAWRPRCLSEEKGNDLTIRETGFCLVLLIILRSLGFFPLPAAAHTNPIALALRHGVLTQPTTHPSKSSSINPPKKTKKKNSPGLLPPSCWLAGWLLLMHRLDAQLRPDLVHDPRHHQRLLR